MAGANDAQDVLAKSEKTVDAVLTAATVYELWKLTGHPGWGVLGIIPDIAFCAAGGWYVWKYFRTHKFFD